MADQIKTFQEYCPSLESYWRSMILFGRNVASYKFALAKSILEIMPTGKSTITLEELAIPFSKNICEHLANGSKQATSNSSQFLETCQAFNNGTVTYEHLIDTTVKKGFNNVIDAFHVVNNANVPIKFYEKDYLAGNKKIILTDNVFKLQELSNYSNLMQEAEARWSLVETAWSLQLSRNLLNIQYDELSHDLFTVPTKLRRKNITSARDALNGYQKGKCFYCFDDISIDINNPNLCDVDHFFPYALQPLMPKVNLNGVWNLVLSCNKCNRGLDGKFAKVPSSKYLERLHKRNEFLISSHHPLRETLIAQTGLTTFERVAFLQKMDNFAIDKLIHRWNTELVGTEVF